MKKVRMIWMYLQMFVYQKLGMAHRVQKFFLDQESVKQKSTLKLKWIMRRNIIPHNRFMAAIRLYEVGEKDVAIEYLINQMNLYKKPGTAFQIISETCVNAAIALGRLKDSRAQLPLLQALGSLPFFGASYALSLFNGESTIADLKRRASLDTEKGIHAAVALGYMRHESALPFLLTIYENKKDFDFRYGRSFSSSGLCHYVYKIIGLYDDEKARRIFLSNLTDSYIDGFLFDHVHHEKFPAAYTIGHDVGWQITKKYGWDKYLDSDEPKFAFMSVFLTSWDTYFKGECPFETQDEVDTLKKAIRRKIWDNLCQM